MARSPDQQNEVRVKEWCTPPDCGIKAEITSRFPPLKLGQLTGGWLRFAHIAWSRDSSIVAVLGVNAYGRDIQTAYDVRRGRSVAFEDVRAMLSESIAQTYKLTGDQLRPYRGDAVQWAIRDENAHRLYRSVKQASTSNAR